jgi:hypothetical protein
MDLGMRHVVLAAGLVVAPAPGTAQDDFADIEVVARPGPLPPLRDAIDYYRSFCFEAARQDGRPASPESDSDWQALGAETRRRFGVEDPDAPVFGIADPARHRTLLVKVERFTRPGRLVEHRCTLVVIGGDEHAALPDRMSRLFGGPGTERHVGEAVGAPALPGWRQWLWTAMPARGSASWRVHRPRTGPPSFIVVTDLRFYDSYDYVFGDLKTRLRGDTPVSMLSFSLTRRVR